MTVKVCLERSGRPTLRKGAGRNEASTRRETWRRCLPNSEHHAESPSSCNGAPRGAQS